MVSGFRYIMAGTVVLLSFGFSEAHANLSDGIELADQSVDESDLMVRVCRQEAIRKFVRYAADTGNRFSQSSVQFESAHRVFWKKQIELRFSALFFGSEKQVGRVTVATFASENNSNECR
jgi:hypothetical protein